jgi:sodium/bile acid cotransporter 7
VVLASVLPASGQVAQGFEWLTVAAVSLLFFLHGAKLSRDAVLAGIRPLAPAPGGGGQHLVLFRCWAGAAAVLQPLVTPDLYLGVLFLCALPATVQSAIAFTAWRAATCRPPSAAPRPPP